VSSPENSWKKSIASPPRRRLYSATSPGSSMVHLLVLCSQHSWDGPPLGGTRLLRGNQVLTSLSWPI